jgi:hypothetical protein
VMTGSIETNTKLVCRIAIFLDTVTNYFLGSMFLAERAAAW